MGGGKTLPAYKAEGIKTSGWEKEKGAWGFGHTYCLTCELLTADKKVRK
jgi:hypothetical protein